jgi:hypothetical protein
MVNTYRAILPVDDIVFMDYEDKLVSWYSIRSRISTYLNNAYFFCTRDSPKEAKDDVSTLSLVAPWPLAVSVFGTCF